LNVFITGSAGGLGRVIATECSRRGYHLFLTDINEDGLYCIKRGLERQFSTTVNMMACDLTSSVSVDQMLAVIDRLGIDFDMLLNIAGIECEGDFLGRAREDVVSIVSVNDAATLRITHAILQRRKVERHFIVVFVASLAAMFPMPYKATYAASKRFLLDFSLALRQELKKQNVNVLAFCPGGMVTTNEAIEGIAVQGIWGDITTNPLAQIARKMIDRALSGRSMYLPGFMNHVLCIFSKVIPRSWLASMIYWRWTATQNKGH